MDFESCKKMLKEYIESLNTISVEGIEMMNEKAGITFKINDGKIVGIV